MFDCHMHTHLSGDSQAQLAQMCQAALQTGIGTLCITEHESDTFVCSTDKFCFKYFTEIFIVNDIIM